MQLLTDRPTPSKPPGARRSGGWLATRRGSLAIAALAALIGAGALALFLNRYKHSLTDSQPVKVLVASGFIAKGSPGDALATSGLFKYSTVKRRDRDDHAITKPAALEGKTAARDIYAGQQLVTADFTANLRAVLSRVTAYQRVMNVSVDGAHGLIGKLKAGDRVDVLASAGGGGGAVQGVRVLARNVLVLATPAAAGGGLGGGNETNVTLRVDDRLAPALALAQDAGKVWIVLRPVVGAKDHGAVSKAPGTAGSTP